MRRLLAPLLLVAAPAFAQTAAAPKEDVVVTARTATPREEAQRLARAVSLSSGGQLARFSTAVCAASVGLPGSYDGFVIRRIEAAARAAGIAVEGKGCRPNVIAAFVDDGRALFAELDRTHSPLLRALSAEERRQLLATTGPVRMISLTELKSRDGDRLHNEGLAGFGLPGSSAPVMEVRTASNLNPPTRVDIRTSLILVDRPAMIGRTFGQVADYVAMRALARTRDGKVAVGDDTILTLFTPGATPPRSLTAFDTAYLRGLYKGPANRSATTKVADIARGAASER